MRTLPQRNAINGPRVQRIDHDVGRIQVAVRQSDQRTLGEKTGVQKTGVPQVKCVFDQRSESLFENNVDLSNHLETGIPFPQRPW